MRFPPVGLLLISILGLVLLVGLKDTRPVEPRDLYDRVQKLLLQGHYAESQKEAEIAHRLFETSDPKWAVRFQILAAEDMLWRAQYDPALNTLAVVQPSLNPDDEIRKLAIEAIALTRQQQIPLAEQRLSIAAQMCRMANYPTCGDVLRARGSLAMAQGQYETARKLFLDMLTFAQAHQDRFLQGISALNLSWAALQMEHFDEAKDWSQLAIRTSTEIGAEGVKERASGNMGFAYLSLGDGERALELFLSALRTAETLGDTRAELEWLTTAGDVYQQDGDLLRASRSYKDALKLARRTNSKEDIVNALEELADVSIEAGEFDEARFYLQQLEPRAQASGNRFDVMVVMYARARIAAALHYDQEAESGFRAVENDPASRTSMRLGAEHELARMYEARGDEAGADRLYRTSLATFESARAQLKKEESRLPFAANATGVYDDYIHFLVERGKGDAALAFADQSRARTLAQGLGVASGNQSAEYTGLRPADVARKRKATLLFYWLGQRQSYLWAITPTKTALCPLPPQRKILLAVERYRKTLLGLRDPIETSDSDGAALYRTLIAPASGLIKPGSTVIVLNDGPLSLLNFETLIAPNPTPHYWIEDATLISAPSLSLLASAKPAKPSSRKLLLIGDAVSPGPDYPELPMAATEMKRIQEQFSPPEKEVFSRDQATAVAYERSASQQFAYIHFVTHGVASRIDPLDSAIILSRSSAAEDSFKLHAREIIEHPLNANLVTISACYSGGTRSYAGEGLVGLAWAFLRAGAHNVIGALWEVSDESTALMMSQLYRGLTKGDSPASALRQAKLALLHSRGSFRKPFFWAPLQVYTGL